MEGSFLVPEICVGSRQWPLEKGLLLAVTVFFHSGEYHIVSVVSVV
jgi:hypothetical protein